MLAEKYAAQSDRGLFNAALMTVMCAGFVSALPWWSLRWSLHML